MLCAGAARDGLRLCPYHAAVVQLRILGSRFGSSEGLPLDLPLFPAAQGGIASKKGDVSSLRLFLQEPVGARTPNVLAIGGHSIRVSGAQFLAGLGIELGVIMLVARW